MHSQVKSDIKNAVLISTVTAISYFACYFSKNILSVATPEIIESDFLSIENIGTLSSVFMICYAIGQLINGIVGDILNAKYMVSLGLLLSGICVIALPLSNSFPFILTVYGLNGFFLSMLFAPLTKCISENCAAQYVSKGCLALTFATCLGAPAAGIAILFFKWKKLFILSGVFSIIIGLCFYIFYVFFENKKIIKTTLTYKADKPKKDIKLLFKNSIIKFSLIAMLTGVVRTSVLFWIPTYLSQFLRFSDSTSSKIYSVITFAISVSSYISILFFYDICFKKKTNAMLITMFSLSSVCFVAMIFAGNRVINIILFTVAIISSYACNSIIWNIYCPGLKDTGLVSTASGYLDFVSYMAAAIANRCFANSVTDFGWKTVILIWASFMIIGVFVSLPYKNLKFILRKDDD